QVHRLVLHTDATTGPIAQNPRNGASPRAEARTSNSIPHSPTDPSLLLLAQALEFTRHAPGADQRYAPRLTRRLAVPPINPPNSSDQPITLARAYSKALHPHSISPSEFTSFIDALNILIAASPFSHSGAHLLAETSVPLSPGDSSSEHIVPSFLLRA